MQPKPPHKVVPAPTPPALPPGKHRVAAVFKDSGTWAVYALEIEGDRVLSVKRIHGPDAKRVCDIRAMKENML